jgi:hypothetical protein
MGGKANVSAAWRRCMERIAPAIAVGWALLAGLLLATSSAAAATDYTAGRPLAVVAHAPGDEELYWQGADGYLWESAESGGQWRGPVRTPIGGLASSPAATIGPGGADYVFWEGTNRALWEAWTTPGGWSPPTQVGMGPLGSQPTATSWGNASGTVEIDVFWQGTDGNLWRGYYDVATGKWTGPSNLGMGALGSAPTAAAQGSSSGAQIQVFWKGRDSALWEGDTSGGVKWSGPTSHGMGPLGSAPSVGAVSTTDGTVFWEGTNAKLWQGAWSGSSWAGPTQAGLGPLGSAPTVAVASSHEQDIFWIGSGSTLWEARYVNQTWTSVESIGSMVPPPPTQTAPVPVTVQPPQAGPQRQIRVRIVMSWSWSRLRTRLRAIRFGRLPARATIRVTCHGHACPRRLGTVRRRHLRALIRSLEARVFRAGQRLTITISAPGWIPERAQIRIRDGALPLAKLL